MEVKEVKMRWRKGVKEVKMRWRKGVKGGGRYEVKEVEVKEVEVKEVGRRWQGPGKSWVSGEHCGGPSRMFCSESRTITASHGTTRTLQPYFRW